MKRLMILLSILCLLTSNGIANTQDTGTNPPVVTFDEKGFINSDVQIGTKGQFIIAPSYAISFHNEAPMEIGRLSFASGTLVFEGKADESAKVFFEQFLKPMVDEYIRRECKAEQP